MKFEKQHGLEQNEAVVRLQALTDYWFAKYGVDTRWDGSVGTLKGKVRGVKFEGTVRVEQYRLSTDIKVGFLAERLGGKKYVQGKIADYLNPANSLESLRARVPK